ncbi:MAG: hypothetical protein GWP11_08510 [Proteobacteria bacterium]|nr:hypothetical protein [Pseudomonadota bacterium]
MNEEISKLINLQEIDSEIAGFDQEIKAKRQEIAAREQGIADKEEEAAKCRKKSAALEQEQRDIKAECEDARAHIKDRQNKMMHIQTSREHQALLKEIEDSKRLIKESEDQAILYMEQIEQLQIKADELENLCAGEKKLLTEEIDKVERAVKRIANRKKKVESERGKIAPDLLPGTLHRYDMLLKKRNGSAVVETINGICQGCFMSIPPQQFNEVRKGDKLNFCPTCQRVLYFKEEETEACDA